MSSRERISGISMFILVLVFSYTAISKLMNMRGFVLSMKMSPLLETSAPFLAWAVIIAEVMAVALLFFPSRRFEGFLLSFLLMSAFTAYIAYMLYVSSELPCSCGGVLKSLTWKEHLYLNIFLTILSFLGMRAESGNDNYHRLRNKSLLQ